MRCDAKCPYYQLCYSLGNGQDRPWDPKFAPVYHTTLRKSSQMFGMINWVEHQVSKGRTVRIEVDPDLEYDHNEDFREQQRHGLPDMSTDPIQILYDRLDISRALFITDEKGKQSLIFMVGCYDNQ